MPPSIHNVVDKGIRPSIGFSKHFRRFDVELRIYRERSPADVVRDADREMTRRTGFGQFIVDRLNHGRREFFRGKPISATDDGRLFRKATQSLSTSFVQGGDHIEIERLPHRTRLFGPIQHGEGSGGRWKSSQESLNCERTIEAHLQDADALITIDQQVDRLMNGLSA